MSSRIHMETERVREMASRMRYVSDQICDEMQVLSRRVNNIEWEGPTRDYFVRRFRSAASGINRTANELDQLANMVILEVNQWEDAARTFIGKYQGSSPGSAYRPHFDDMRGLAKELMRPENSNGNPLRIVKIGDNEYVILIQGTVVDKFDPSNNWGSAGLSGMGLPADFEQYVRDEINKLPPGAKIHMVGHSQGGIVANNLADNSEITSKYDVESVTTFGSPVSARENSEVAYQRYSAGTDFVPLANLRTVRDLMLSVFLGRSMLSPTLDMAGKQTYVDSGTINPIDSHGAYPDSQELSRYGLPFNIKTWEPVNLGDAPNASNGLSVVLADVASGDPVRMLQGFYDLPAEVAESLTAGAANLALDEFTKTLPDEIYQKIDQYRDRVMEDLVDNKRSSQVVVENVQATVGAVEKGVEQVKEGLDKASAALSEKAGQVFGSFAKLVPDVI